MAELGMAEGGRAVHYLIHGTHSPCGRSYLVKVGAMPPGSRMCGRCTRRDGLSLECGCDISGAMLRQDGVTAFCGRCEADVTLIRDEALAPPRAEPAAPKTHYRGDFAGRAYMCGQGDAGAYAADGVEATCAVCQRCALVKVTVSCTSAGEAQAFADAVAALDGWEVAGATHANGGRVRFTARRDVRRG